MMNSPVDYRGQTTLSSDIGAEFARQLAERGSDLILVARRLDRLESLAEKLSERFGVRIDAIALNLSQFFDVLGTDAADGGTPRQTPAQVVDTALRALDRKNPAPSVISERRNQIMALGGCFVSRRLLISVLGRMTGQAQ
jgi:NAD(P)-dependent dehydrogenase (short-subunit alcohol dehydrogenase family)